MDKSKKICLTVKAFLKHPNLTLVQLAALPELKGISKSSIQRYLNDSLIVELFDKKTFNKIQEMLEIKASDGHKKGGMNSFKNNKAIKDSSGKFTGTIKSSDEHRVEKKIKHILTFANIYIGHPNMSLQEIADFYNKMNHDGEVVTRDYVYDCLSSREQYNVLSEQLWDMIAIQLEQRRNLGNINGANVTNLKK